MARPYEGRSRELVRTALLPESRSPPEEEASARSGSVRPRLDQPAIVPGTGVSVSRRCGILSSRLSGRSWRSPTATDTLCKSNGSQRPGACRTLKANAVEFVGDNLPSRFRSGSMSLLAKVPPLFSLTEACWILVFSCGPRPHRSVLPRLQNP